MGKAKGNWRGEDLNIVYPVSAVVVIGFIANMGNGEGKCIGSLEFSC